MTQTVAISTGPQTHLDHLAPLSFLLEIPLIVTEEEQMELGKEFYPMLNMQYLSLKDLTLEYIATHFGAIVETGKFWAMELKPLIKLFFQRDLRIIFSPHGNSDKESFLKKPTEQDIDLAYGPQMLQLKSGKNVIETGNLRLVFYHLFKKHFDQLAQKKIFSSLNPKKKTILYAPTWDTHIAPTSFFAKADQIISTLHTDHNLLIKLHPLLEENHPAHFHRILATYADRVTFVLEFPLIYPLLEKVDIYLGDYSSIGYDFLYYNRPMFFLGTGGELQKCGELYAPHLITNRQEELSSIRSQMYREAFGTEKELKEVGEKIRLLLKN